MITNNDKNDHLWLLLVVTHILIKTSYISNDYKIIQISTELVSFK